MVRRPKQASYGLGPGSTAIEPVASERRFMPRREAAIRISEETQALNRAAFIEQQRTVTTMQSSLQQPHACS